MCARLVVASTSSRLSCPAARWPSPLIKSCMFDLALLCGAVSQSNTRTHEQQRVHWSVCERSWPLPRTASSNHALCSCTFTCKFYDAKCTFHRHDIGKDVRLGWLLHGLCVTHPDTKQIAHMHACTHRPSQPAQRRSASTVRPGQAEGVCGNGGEEGCRGGEGCCGRC